MIKFYNNNAEYGEDGPFVADTKEELAEGMQDTFEGWAQKRYDDDQEHLASADEDKMEMPRDEWIAADIAEMRAEYIDGLEAQWHGKPRLVFDNAGDVTLQLPGYAHTYVDVELCAIDIAWFFVDLDADGWDGNEEEAVFEPTQNEIANGGYRVALLSDFLDLKNGEEYNFNSWGNIRDLWGALKMRDALN